MEARKLLPKVISRRRSKSSKKSSSPNKDAATDVALTEATTPTRRPHSSQTFESNNGTGSTRNEDEDDDDKRSFGSYQSSADAEPDRTRSSTTTTQPTRPGIPSAHPSLIGYLTTSSPIVQAAHLNSSSQTRSRQVSRAEPSRSPYATSSDPGSEHSLEAPEPPAPAKILNRLPNGKPAKIATEAPRTPPSGDKAAPRIINTPPTPTEFTQSAGTSSPDKRASWGQRTPTDGGSPTPSAASTHRRSKSGSATVVPSKLSHITTAPLTPTPESGEQTTAAGGFFSSVLSAAQNAANTLSNTIPGTGIGIGGARKGSGIPKSQSSPATTQANTDSSPIESDHDKMEPPNTAAVRTLGTGELSLSQLGLAEPSSNMASPASVKFPDIVDTRLRSESAPVDAKSSELIADEQSNSRPRSLLDSPSGDDGSADHDQQDMKSSMQRSSSVRSAPKPPHRKRGSSVTTGATVAAGFGAGSAVGGTSGGPAQSTPGLGAPKLTGFAIASKKRNRDFHSFFKSVPDDDYLIEDYSCALQREILAHGRLYVSEGHLCFSSNILGWTTTLVMSFDEIVSVEKRSTALVFKNGLMISTLHAKHIFASFTSRDATYDLIVNIWKLGHPTLKSTLNGVQLEGTGGDKTEKVDAEPQGLGIEANSPAGSDSELSDDDEDDDDEFYDEEDHDDMLDTQPTEVSGMDVEMDKTVSRKVSTMTATNGTLGSTDKDASSPATGSADFPGPATHAPTDCGDSASHYEKQLGDDIIPAPLGKVYALMFGSSSPVWMTKWLDGEQKCFDIQMDDKKGLSLENKTRTYSYIKPLYASLGPKQTKCVVSETVETLDYEKAINVSGSTQTPDVPSGNLFTVKTKYCLSWAENNATRVQVNCTVEWSGKSWIKGPIEKGVGDGQGQYCKDIFAALKTAVSTRVRSGTLTGNGKSKKKGGKRGKTNQPSRDATESNAKRAALEKTHWGIFEPTRTILEPILDLLKPILTGNVVYGLLVGLLVASWFGFGFAPNKSSASFGRDMDMYGPYRLAAYEEMWRREDSQLWDWLEERAGLDRLSTDGGNMRKRAIEPRSVEERLREERMDAREVQEAIRVTEEKLKVLREVVNKAKQSRSTEKEL